MNPRVSNCDVIHLKYELTAEKIISNILGKYTIKWNEDLYITYEMFSNKYGIFCFKAYVDEYDSPIGESIECSFKEFHDYQPKS